MFSRDSILRIRLLPSGYIVLFSLSACLSVKKYPVHKPFIYKTTIKVEGAYSSKVKKEVESGLYNQLHDSIHPPIVKKYVFWNVLKKPPVYDSLHAEKSIGFMKGLLHSLGYYRDSVWYRDTVLIKGDQKRTAVHFSVLPGPLF